MKTYVITGGCGFIGGHLARALLQTGAQVTIIDDLSTGRAERAPDEAGLVVADINTPGVLREIMREADGCFHLAAVASVQRCNEDWINSHRTNLTGTISVFDAASEGGKPVVWASSAAVYGDPDVVRIDESIAPAPLTAYGADKLGGELHGVPAARIHGVPNIALRFFNVYGPGQDPKSPYSGVISIFADRLAAGNPVTINGDGEQSRDFVHVSDVVRGLIAAMTRLETEKAEGEPATFRVSNLCTGTRISINQLAATLSRVIGVQARITYGPAREGDIRHSLGSPNRMHDLLGVRAEVALEDGLRWMIDEEEAPKVLTATG